MMSDPTGKLVLIQANGGQRVCVHGSLYCRRCYGEKVGHHEKNHISHKRKNK